MNFEHQDRHGLRRGYSFGAGRGDMRRALGPGPGPDLMGANTLLGSAVYNREGEDVGEIKEILLNMRSGKVAYAVLSFGGFLGRGKKLFAVPWKALTLDTEHKRFVLNVAKERLQNAPGFDKDQWPDMADESWGEGVQSYDEVLAYWEDDEWTNSRSDSRAV